MSQVGLALKLLPPEAGERYPLRTRFIICSQIAGAAAEEVLENLHRRGEAQEADAADKDRAAQATERGLAAFVILSDLISKLD